MKRQSFGKGLLTVLQVIALMVSLLPASALARETDWLYTVRPDDTLWEICQRLVDVTDCSNNLAVHNQVGKPQSLPPGSQLKIPVSWLRLQPASARVVSFTGQVHYKKTEDTDKIPVSIDMPIEMGYAVFTEEDSNVLIKFADNSTLLLLANGSIRFDRLSMHGRTGMVDTRLRLSTGSSTTRVTPFKNPKSRFDITTPAAVAAVRGTEFRVVVLEQGEKMKSEVLHGAVGISAEQQRLAVSVFPIKLASFYC